MKRASWLALALALGLLMPLVGAPAGGMAQPPSRTSRPAAIQSLTLDPPIDIWVDGLQNFAPAVAYNSRQDEYLVVWYTQQGANTEDIWARRVGSDGSLRSSFNVATGEAEKRWQPVVAYSPAQDGYLIVYIYMYSSSDLDLYAKLVSSDGGSMSSEYAIKDEADLQVAPRVAYNNVHDEYLVVYQNRWADNRKDIAAQRVRASDGALLSWRNIATGTDQWRVFPDVAYNEARNQYLIVYHYYDASDVEGRSKWASHDLADLGPEVPPCAPPDFVGFPRVAAGPDEYLVVWINNVGATSDSIFARLVYGEEGEPHPGDGFEIGGTGTKIKLLDPNVAFGPGYGYLVTWEYFTGSRTDVYGRYVMRGQNSPAGDSFTVVGTAQSQEQPAVACGPSGDCLVVWADSRAAGGGAGDYEIRGRFVRLHHTYLPTVLRDQG
jgi:hypothetical protein